MVRHYICTYINEGAMLCYTYTYITFFITVFKIKTNYLLPQGQGPVKNSGYTPIKDEVQSPST